MPHKTISCNIYQPLSEFIKFREKENQRVCTFYPSTNVYKMITNDCKFPIPKKFRFEKSIEPFNNLQRIKTYVITRQDERRKKERKISRN